MSSSKCLFTCICGIFLPLHPSTTTVYAWSAFYPSLRFTLRLQSAFYTQSAFYPWSAVCSLRLTLTGQKPVQRRGSGEKCVYFATCLPSRGQPQQASYPGQFAPSEFVQVQLCMFSRLHQRRTVKQKLIDNQTVSHTENFKHPHLVTCISAPKCEPLVLSYQLRSISLLKVVAAKRVYCASFPVILNDSLPWLC